MERTIENYQNSWTKQTYPSPLVFGPQAQTFSVEFLFATCGQRLPAHISLKIHWLSLDFSILADGMTLYFIIGIFDFQQEQNQN